MCGAGKQEEFKRLYMDGRRCWKMGVVGDQYRQSSIVVNSRVKVDHDGSLIACRLVLHQGFE